MAAIIDISSWNEQPWLNTGGTRNKKIFADEQGELHYFKESFFKPDRDYRFEFWSEIIASRLGKILGFDILQYIPAINGNVIGCLSKSMILPNEELKEGGKYLQAFDQTYNPKEKISRKQYSFELIVNGLIFFKLNEYLPHFLETLVFDAIIGNGDRHQENWAFISEQSLTGKSINVALNVDILKDLPRVLQRLVRKRFFVKDSDELNLDGRIARVYFGKTKGIAPIYDSGSSLGRELSEEQIIPLINSSDLMLNYINKGMAEVHWDNNKLNHFDLISKVCESYPNEIKRTINRVRINYLKDKLETILNDVDRTVPSEFSKFKLSDSRKLFILKSVSLRIERLCSENI